MNQEYIDYVNRRKAYIREAEIEAGLQKQQLEARLAAMRIGFNQLTATCDHRLPDGTSADDGGFIGACTVCGNILG